MFALIRAKFKRGADLVACAGFNEKIIITPLANLLGIRVVWIEYPALNSAKLSKFASAIYKLSRKPAEIAVFSGYSKIKLKNMGCDENKITIITPGAAHPGYQKNIFSNMAATAANNFQRKYFTIGAITPLDQKQKIETAFQAVKICAQVIPDIQFVIVGNGPEKKNLLWLAKKMEIENLIWMIGERSDAKKWLANFDIFLALGDNLCLDDYGNIAEAMASGLPVLGTRNIGLEDMVVENKTGALVESGNSEMLARQIIKLHQDKRLRLHLGANGRELACRSFTLEKMAEGLANVFNSSL